MFLRFCPALQPLRSLLHRARRFHARLVRTLLLSALTGVLAPPLAQGQSYVETKLFPSDGETSDLFGFYAVALSADGQYAIVGAYGDRDNGSTSGSAYVFVREGTEWTEQAKLLPGDGQALDFFGFAVAISGDGQYALVGASNDGDNGNGSGSAYIFARNGAEWVEQAKLTASDGAPTDAFGYAVALSADGGIAFVGAPADDDVHENAGSVYVFVRDGPEWSQEAKLLPSADAEVVLFGVSVSLGADGLRGLVGAGGEGAETGKAHVFAYDGAEWVEEAMLLAGDGGDGFGQAVSLSADAAYALVGAPNDDGDTGSAYVYARDGSTWTEEAKLTASDAEEDVSFGGAVALSADGEVALVGAPGDDENGNGSGSAYVFAREVARGGSTWTEQTKLTASDPVEGDNFGSGVAINGDGQYLLTGAPSADGQEENSGSAYVFRKLPPPPPGQPYVYTLGGISFDEGADVGVDAEGNATFTGEFSGTLDFDPGAGTAELTSTQSDVYVASYDPEGALRFAFQIGNGLATSEAAGGLAVGADGSFVVTGSQPFGAIDFDPDPTAEALRTGRLFVAGYDAGGGFRFAVTPEGGTGSAGTGRAVALDEASNVYVTGLFQGTLNFAPGAQEPSLLTSDGGQDMFVASYTPDGAFRSAFGVGGEGNDTGEGIAVDAAGNVYVTGQFGPIFLGKVEGGGNEGAGGGGRQAFLASYTPDGAIRFVYLLGIDAKGEAVALDAADNVYLAGSFVGTATFDPSDADGDGDTEEVTETAGGSAFLVSYTPDGLFRFVSVPDGTSNTLGLTTLGSGVSFITGSFGGTVDFDPGPGVETLSAGSGTDVFVASYDAEGAFRSAFGFGGDGLNTGSGIDAIDTQSISLTGWYSGTTDFDPTEGVDERTGAGQNDLFMAKYLPETVPVAAEEPVAALLTASLSAAYPNPFAARTTLLLSVPLRQHVEVVAYDVTGRRVAVLFDGKVEPGQAQPLTFDAGSLPAGLYLIRAEGEGLRATRRVVHVH